MEQCVVMAPDKQSKDELRASQAVHDHTQSHLRSFLKTMTAMVLAMTWIERVYECARSRA